MSILTRDFYTRDTLTAAKELLGKILVSETAQGVCKGIIVETEAYIGPGDKAAHSYKTSIRTNIQYGPGGYAYVYLIYGMYYCMNVVTNIENHPECVLIRALEPVGGLELMERRRNTNKLKNLCSGPGKLCMALGIDKSCYGLDLCAPGLYIEDAQPLLPEQITATKRINISYAEEAADYPWRFIVKDSGYLSL